MSFLLFLFTMISPLSKNDLTNMELCEMARDKGVSTHRYSNMEGNMIICKRKK